MIENMSEKKKSFLIFFVLFSVLVGGVAYYYSYMRTPEYAFKAVEEGFEKHDIQQVYEYMDIPNILHVAVDEMYEEMNKPYREAMEEDGYGPIFDSMIGQFEDMGKTIAYETGKAEVDAIILGRHPIFNKKESGIGSLNPFSSFAKRKLSDAMSVKKLDENNADIYLDFVDVNGKPRHIIMKAGRTVDGKWRIYEMPGIYKIATDINHNR